MRSKMKDYKSGLKKLMKKAGLKYRSTSVEPLPDNVHELEKTLGFYHDDPCVLIVDKKLQNGNILPAGSIGKVYYPYSTEKIVCLFWKIHRSLSVRPSDIEHYTIKGKEI